MAASMNAQRFDGALEWVVSKNNPYPVPDHRNVLVAYRKARAMCLDGGYDALLTVEHDMILPDDAVQLLSETSGDVIFGVYIHRHSSYDLNAYEYVDARTLGPSLTHSPAKALAAKSPGCRARIGFGLGLHADPSASA